MLFWMAGVSPWSVVLEPSPMARWSLPALWCPAASAPSSYARFLTAVMFLAVFVPSIGALIGRTIGARWFLEASAGAVFALLATPLESRVGNGFFLLLFLPWILGGLEPAEPLGPYTDDRTDVSGLGWQVGATLLGVVALAVHPAAIWCPLILFAAAWGAALDGKHSAAKVALVRAAILFAVVLTVPAFRAYLFDAVSALSSGSSIRRSAFGVGRLELIDQRLLVLMFAAAVWMTLEVRMPFAVRLPLLAAWAVLLLAPRAGLPAAVLTGAAIARFAVGPKLFRARAPGGGGSEAAGVFAGVAVLFLLSPPPLPREAFGGAYQRALVLLATQPSFGIPVFHEPESADLLELIGFDPWITARAECIPESSGERDDVLNAFEDVRMLHDGWRERLRELNPRAVVIRERSPIVGTLLAGGWREVARSEPMRLSDRGREMLSPFLLLAPVHGAAAPIRGAAVVTGSGQEVDLPRASLGVGEPVSPPERSQPEKSQPEGSHAEEPQLAGSRPDEPRPQESQPDEPSRSASIPPS